MSDPGDELRLIKSVLGVLPDQGVPKKDSDKLAKLNVGEPEFQFMLATYCFNLSRRLQYLAKAAAPFAANMPPELAREILADNEQINEEGISWKERAHRAEKIMLRLQRENGDKWDKTVKAAANRGAVPA